MLITKTISAMIDHAVLHPTMTDRSLIEECKIAEKYGVASVCVKPYSVSKAIELMDSTSVAVGCVVGFPAGNSAIEVKVFEAKKACDEGAVEVDMVINIAKALEKEWSYIEQEIGMVVEISHQKGAIVKVIFETDYVRDHAIIRHLCEISSLCQADFVKTSTGFGFTRGTDGKYNYTGATLEHVGLMKNSVGPGVKVKASGGIRTLDDLLRMKEAGSERIGTSATRKIMEEAIRRFGNT